MCRTGGLKQLSLQVPCTVTMVKTDSPYYPACSLQFNARACNKKLTDSSGDGTNWFCERCQQQAEPDWRYILAVQVEDHTNGFYLTAFQVRLLLYPLSRGMKSIGVHASIVKRSCSECLNLSSLSIVEDVGFTVLGAWLKVSRHFTV